MFRILYLVNGKPSVIAFQALTIEQAQFHLRRLKRRGFTAWVQTDGGEFVPVKGAMRKPAHL